MCRLDLQVQPVFKAPSLTIRFELHTVGGHDRDGNCYGLLLDHGGVALYRAVDNAMRQNLNVLKVHPETVKYGTIV